MSTLLDGCSTSSKIRALLASRGATQTDLSKLLGVSRETVINRLNDNRWDVKELETIAKAYGIEKQDLI